MMLPLLRLELVEILLGRVRVGLEITVVIIGNWTTSAGLGMGPYNVTENQSSMSKGWGYGIGCALPHMGIWRQRPRKFLKLQVKDTR